MALMALLLALAVNVGVSTMVESFSKPGWHYLARWPSTAATRAARAKIRELTDRRLLHLSVNDAVAIGLRQSDEIGVAAAQVDVAEAQYGAARANVLPQLRFNGAYLHVYESARGQARRAA